MSKIIELAKKLNELAKRGEAGEKINAEKMLAAFMGKHRISMSDIEGDDIKTFEIKVTKEQGTFFFQLCSSVRRRMFVSVSYKGMRAIKCTESERAEIILKFQMLWKSYKEQQELFYQAFVQKNKMYSVRDEEDEAQKYEPTSEEMARRLKIMQIAEGIDKVSIHRQIQSH